MEAALPRECVRVVREAGLRVRGIWDVTHRSGDCAVDGTVHEPTVPPQERRDEAGENTIYRTGVKYDIGSLLYLTFFCESHSSQPIRSQTHLAHKLFRQHLGVVWRRGSVAVDLERRNPPVGSMNRGV